MERTMNKPAADQCNLSIGSSLAAGALMLCHMNSSGLARYDKLFDDLNRLNTLPPPAPPRSARRNDRPQRKRLGWVSWIYR